jgi:hypothetical protein
MINLYELHARELAKMPDNWVMRQWKTMGQDYGIILVIGICAPRFVRGKRKGHINFKKGDKTTEREIYYTKQEHDQWVTDWEFKTGLCSKCTGSGKVFSSWNIETGTKWKPCTACKETGKAQ